MTGGGRVSASAACSARTRPSGHRHHLCVRIATLVQQIFRLAGRNLGAIAVLILIVAGTQAWLRARRQTRARRATT
jgi:hypothetical protein